MYPMAKTVTVYVPIFKRAFQNHVSNTKTKAPQSALACPLNDFMKDGSDILRGLASLSLTMVRATGKMTGRCP
jgi:hypothetical protein